LFVITHPFLTKGFPLYSIFYLLFTLFLLTLSTLLPQFAVYIDALVLNNLDTVAKMEGSPPATIVVFSL
jgi:hypothetical protein